MKQRRPNQKVLSLLFGLAVCAVILLGGCASTGGGKDAGREPEAPSQVEQPRAARSAAGPSSLEARKPPVAAAVSGQKPPAGKAVPKAAAGKAQQPAASAEGGVGRWLADALRNIRWNRVVSVVGGLLAMALIWGLAFWLARLPRRRREVVRRPRSRPIGEPARVAVAA